jgi:hypothetical protein
MPSTVGGVFLFFPVLLVWELIYAFANGVSWNLDLHDRI